MHEEQQNPSGRSSALIRVHPRPKLGGRSSALIRVHPRPKLVFVLAALLALAACGAPVPAPQAQQPAPHAPVSVSARPLAASGTCTRTFVAHTLPHTTSVGDGAVSLYESNGAGVAINDLDGDGLLDIVLANLRGPNTIMWNRGSMAFRPQQLDDNDSRAANIVDVNGDGLQDIVFTHRFAKPTFWRNTGKAGDARFVKGTLPDVNNIFYSMNWADLDGDGALDLVAGSYDTELRKKEGPIFDNQGGGAGVFVYTRSGGRFVPHRLAKEADALAIALFDVDGNGHPDILVGNDFNRRDYAWVSTGEGWEATEPFERTSENTMSLDWGDIDNDGQPELFATDMKPYHKDVATMAEWLPMMKLMTHPATSSDPQITENVLQVRGADGNFHNQAYNRMIDATGWSWSSKFGDLDNDGFLDLYVVNGMIAHELFGHLPHDELVEENRALRNDGHGGFVLAPDWGLGSTASGRGMSMADLDNDGDLDIVVNNLRSPAQLFENQLCGGSGLEVELRWPNSLNRYAIGAQLALHTSAGTFYRDVRAASGYLSGDPARVHFGVPPDATLQRLEVRWPDGHVSNVEPLSSHALVTVTRGSTDIGQSQK